MDICNAEWVFRNKLDEDGKVVNKKARLVAQGNSQEEGILKQSCYSKIFAPIVRL